LAGEVRRVWVFPTEVPDGYWGGNGRPPTWPTSWRVHDPETARALADKPSPRAAPAARACPAEPAPLWFLTWPQRSARRRA